MCAFLGSHLAGELALLLSKLSLMLVADRSNRELLLCRVGVLQEHGENTPEGSEDAGLGTVALLPSVCICSTYASTGWPNRTLSWLVTSSEFGGVALLLNYLLNLMIETHSGSKQAPVEFVDPFVGNTSGKQSQSIYSQVDTNAPFAGATASRRLLDPNRQTLQLCFTQSLVEPEFKYICIDILICFAPEHLLF